MPGASRTITIRFTGNTTSLVKSTRAADKELSAFGDSAKKHGSLIGGAVALGLSAAAPVVAAGLIGGVSLGFIGVTAVVQKNNQQVKNSFSDLKSQVVGEMTSASDQVVPYLVKSGHALQQEFANLGPQLHEAFRFAGPDIDILTTGVDNLATNAMPGLVTSMRNSKPIVQGVSTVLGDLGTTATTVLGSVSSHSKEFGADVAELGPLVQNVGSIVAGVLPGMASGFGTTVGTVNDLLSALKPVAPVVGDITGEVLPAVGAFKLLGLATEPLNKLGERVSGVSDRVGGFATRLTRSDAAGKKVASTTGKVGAALGKVGNALPFVAAGYALADAGAQRLFGTQNQLANSLLNDSGQALKATETQLAKNDATAQALRSTLGGFGGFLANQFVPTTKDTESGLTAVQKAQIRYNQAVTGFGPKSKQAAKAQRELAAANADDQRKQKALAQAMLFTNEQLSNQETLLLGSVDANLGFQSAVLGVQQAQNDYASAVKNSGAKSLVAKQAFLGLQQAQSTEANAAVAAATASHANGTEQQKAKARTDAYAAAVLGMAAKSDGHMTPALKRMVAGLTDAQVSAFTATGKVKGTTQAIVKFHGKSVRVNVDGSGEAVAHANAVRRAIDRVHSKTVHINTVLDTVINGPGAHPIGKAPGVAGLLDLGGRAVGGPVMAGQAYIVGERGRELFVPRQSGTIVPNDQLGASDISGDVVIEIAGEPIARIAKAEIMKSNRVLVTRVQAGSRIR
jgi:hypothetical protein